MGGDLGEKKPNVFIKTIAALKVIVHTSTSEICPNNAKVRYMLRRYGPAWALISNARNPRWSRVLIKV